jgi:general secretion pathway protein K
MRQNTPQTRQNGFILIVVLGAVVVLTVLLFGFHRTTRVRLGAANDLAKAEQAGNCARAGVSVAVAAIGATGDPRSESRLSKLLAGETTIPVGDGACTLTIMEEAGFLNVNSLQRQTGELDRARIDQFLRLIDLLNRQKPGLPRISYGIVPAMIDWIDQDGDVTYLAFVNDDNVGAEEGYYSSLDPPRHCRNRPADVVDDLLGAKGMTPETLGRLRESLTTFGDGKVNINAAPKLVLESLCEQMSPALVEMIVSQRRLKPFRSIVELKDVPGMTDNIYQTIRDTITTGQEDRYYRVLSRGTVQDLSFTAEAVLRRNTQAGNVDIVQYREP